MGAWIFAGCLLLDGNGGGQPFDVIDVRLFHQFQKLTRIGGKGLNHIAALSLRVNGVERQGRFARPAQARDDYQLVSWKRQGNVSEVGVPARL